MNEIAVGVVCFVASLVLIQSGMHIGVALLLLSFVGVWAIKGLAVAGKLLSSSVATSIASDAYAVIPMFVLMGLFVSATNMGRDTFDVAALVLRRIRGALGIATVAANAVFAACTGTTIASASVFTKVAVPEMIRHGHTAKFLGGRRRRQFGARHADPAQHSDDHFRHHRQRLDRRPVHFGHPAGHRARERVLRHDPADVLSEAGLRRRRSEIAQRRVSRIAGRRDELGDHQENPADRYSGRHRAWRHIRWHLHADRSGRRRCAGGAGDRSGPPRVDVEDVLAGVAGDGSRHSGDLFPADGRGALFADADHVRSALRGRPVAAERQSGLPAGADRLPDRAADAGMLPRLPCRSC